MDRPRNSFSEWLILIGIAFIVMSLVGGCHTHDYPPRVPAPKHADIAVEIVKSFYRSEGLRFPPNMEGLWYEDEDGWPHGLTYSDEPSPSHCVWGVAVVEGQIHSTSALAHELLHCAFAETYNDGNGEHDWPEWEIEERANELLASYGL